MGDLITLKKSEEYTAELFTVGTIYGGFKIAGTLCGSIDVALPQDLGTLTLDPDESLSLINALTAARHDVLENSRPYSDPRLVG